MEGLKLNITAGLGEFFHQQESEFKSYVFFGDELVAKVVKKENREHYSNAKLLAAAKLALETAYNTYVFLQKESNKNVQFAIDSEPQRIELRDYIAKASGKTGQAIQEYIEQEALKN